MVVCACACALACGPTLPSEPSRSATPESDGPAADAGDTNSPDDPGPLDAAGETGIVDADMPEVPDVRGVDATDDLPDQGEGCGAAPGQIFLPGAPWNQPVVDAPLAADSDTIIGYLSRFHDTETRFQIDFSLVVLAAVPEDEPRPFEPTEDHWDIECDTAPVPVPERGLIEGEEGLSCIGDGDCHLLVRAPGCRLYEMYRADIRGDVFRGGCLAVWDTQRIYPATGRGQDCTSADAAGLPITPLVFRTDEIGTGELRHAIRFVLPNENIRKEVYVLPATHSTSATEGPIEAPPYGARLRLKNSVDLSQLNPAAQVVAMALQRYGMILADGGNLTFTAASDRNAANTWANLGLGPHDLKQLNWSDFEVVDGGVPVQYRGNCSRVPITE